MTNVVVKQIDFKSIKANSKHVNFKSQDYTDVLVEGIVLANKQKTADCGIKTLSQGFFKVTLPDDNQGECTLESELLLLPDNICASIPPLSKISFTASITKTGMTVHDISTQSIKDLI